MTNNVVPFAQKRCVVKSTVDPMSVVRFIQGRLEDHVRVMKELERDYRRKAEYLEGASYERGIERGAASAYHAQAEATEQLLVELKERLGEVEK